jgi:membrane dipeptidase
MPLGRYIDRRGDPAGWAAELGVSREAVEVYLDCDVIDLNIQSFIWSRTFGYDLAKRHGPGLLGARYFRQVDLPRVREARLGGAIWSITTNPWRRRTARPAVFARNAAALKQVFAAVAEEFVIARTAADYRRARAEGKHAAFLGIQGGNAVDADGEALDLLGEASIVCVTLVHLSSSRVGSTSSPARGPDRGLSDFGRSYVERLNAERIFVDLSHVSRRGFFDAVSVHDKSQPLMVSHTGVSAVTASWRNVDDEQLRAVAETGGVIGVIFHGGYLGGSYWTGGSASAIVDHLEHIVNQVGEDHAALGSDWDGAIITPRDMRTCLELPRLVQLMLARGFSAERVRKIMGGNFLRALALLRG